jgi:L-threonylcarbamoyladenylate synthase
MKTEILNVTSDAKEYSKLKRAADVLERGGVVVFPTDTVYGLAANAFIMQAQRKIYALKGRSFDKPLILMPDRIKTLRQLVNVPPQAVKLIHKFWPGPLTLIMPTNHMGKIIMGGRVDVGVRIPDNKIVVALLKLCSFPLLTTSANVSGKPSAKSFEEAKKYFNNKVELMLDAGPCRTGRESTVIDILRFPYTIVREGCLSKEEIISVTGC